MDVKVTSTDKMNEAFKEKDEKYREWTTKETREKKIAMAVIVPIIISHDGAVHRDTIKRWTLHQTLMWTGFGWHRACWSAMS